jgi:hypothetical protein
MPPTAWPPVDKRAVFLRTLIGIVPVQCASKWLLADTLITSSDFLVAPLLWEWLASTFAQRSGKNGLMSAEVEAEKALPTLLPAASVYEKDPIGAPQIMSIEARVSHSSVLTT